MLVSLVACGGGGGGGGGGSTPEPALPANPDLSARNYLPTTPGARWIYQASDSTALVINRITGSRSVAGGTGAIMQSTDPKEGETVLLEDKDGVRQFPGNNADPLSLAGGPIQLLRYPLRVGDSFLTLDKNIGAVIDFDGDGVLDAISIRAETQVIGLESIDTPAGRLADCLHTRTSGTVTVQSSILKRAIVVNSVTDDWRAPGVGQVRSETTVSSEGVTQKSNQTVTAYGVGSLRSEYMAPSATAPGLGTGQPLGPGASVDIAFSEAMDSSTLATALTVLDAKGQAVAGSITVGERSIKFLPSSPWQSGTYVAKLGTQAQDVVGNALAAAQQWSFSVDATAPTLLASSPIEGAVDVPLASAIALTFSEPVDPASANTDNIRVYATSAHQALSDLTVSGAQITLRLAKPLPRGSKVSVEFSQLKDLAGNALAYQRLSFTADPGRFGPALRLTPSAAMTKVGEYVAAGDLNGDGRIDVVASTRNFDTAWRYGVEVFYQQVDGSLAKGVPIHLNGNCEIAGLAIGDVSADGRPDLVVNRGNCGLAILTQSALGTLQMDSTIENPALAGAAVKLADMNGDGRLDIVSVGGADNLLLVWLNNAGTWVLNDSVSVPVRYTGGLDLVVGDLNGDSRADVAVFGASLESFVAAVLFYQGADAHLAAPVLLRPGGLNETAQSLAIGDINGDGRADLVLYFRASGLAFMHQGSNGLLGEAQPMGDGSQPLLLADINGDGRLDMVMGGLFTDAITTRLQASDGSFTAAASYPAKFKGFSAYSGVLAVGDVNGDGRPDVIFADEVFLQRPVPLMAEAVKPGPGIAATLTQGIRAIVRAAVAAQTKR
ncbi:hypothetical protein HNP55_001810 [Paucibacter oligotrophus]|uniref:SbsA Ig-like domain-containing protein n=1 Tax=Roseateles oligotrophus TaxID=1769250 RepID=A0A840L673_9BURK|nr:hypothetical protein [Roseateles oligotrophus]